MATLHFLSIFFYLDTRILFYDRYPVLEPFLVLLCIFPFFQIPNEDLFYIYSHLMVGVCMHQAPDLVKLNKILIYFHSQSYALAFLIRNFCDSNDTHQDQEFFFSFMEVFFLLMKMKASLFLLD